jgi:hypothetical protein
LASYQLPNPNRIANQGIVDDYFTIASYHLNTDPSRHQVAFAKGTYWWMSDDQLSAAVLIVDFQNPNPSGLEWHKVEGTVSPVGRIKVMAFAGDYLLVAPLSADNDVDYHVIEAYDVRHGSLPPALHSNLASHSLLA